MTDADTIRRLLAKEAARFCHAADIVKAINSGPDEGHVHALRATVASAMASPRRSVDDGERALFAAIALSLVNDSTGVPILKDPGSYWATNSNLEVALAQIALVLLGELKPPLRFINASLIAELARTVGAWPLR